MKINVTGMIYDRMVQNAREASERRQPRREEHWCSAESRSISHDPPKPESMSVWMIIAHLFVMFLWGPLLLGVLFWLFVYIHEPREAPAQAPTEVEK